MNINSIKSIIKAAALASLVTVGAASAQNNVKLRPSEPTHYFLTPMAKVNDPYHMVVGLHEISYALPGRLQLQLSLIDNIGKTMLGAKYSLADNMAIGGGMAGSLIDMGHHGPGEPYRLGAFFTYAIAEHSAGGVAVTPHLQLGSRISIGADIGFMVKPTAVWGFIGEAGISVDTKDEMLYLFGIGGLRISPPPVPFMFIDVGIKTNEFGVQNDPDIHPRVFVDLLVCFITG